MRNEVVYRPTIRIDIEFIKSLLPGKSIAKWCEPVGNFRFFKKLFKKLQKVSLCIKESVFITMTKFVKIVCIGFCFGICNLRSETYNVITISRDTTAASYNRLSEEEIHLVFKRLASLISDGPTTEAEKGSPATKLSPTIVVFNEAFFGQDKPLSKEEVDKITNIYKELPNTYLCMNFLYKDTYTEGNKKEYDPQIEISKRRYTEILTKEGDKTLTTIMQPSFIFGDRIQECIDDDNLDTEIYIEKEKSYLGTSQRETIEFEHPLLFNQIKIFYGGKEIGYYNKSSFCSEIPDFLELDKKPYYVIGNFNTIYKETSPLQIDCLTCYDIDVVTKDQMPKRDICVFVSNTSASLPLTLNNFNGPGTKLSNFYICADPKSETESKNISGILSNIRNSFEYLTEESGEEKDVFYFKSFSLTDDSIIERFKP